MIKFNDVVQPFEESTNPDLQRHNVTNASACAASLAGDLRGRVVVRAAAAAASAAHLAIRQR